MHKYIFLVAGDLETARQRQRQRARENTANGTHLLCGMLKPMTNGIKRMCVVNLSHNMYACDRCN